LGVASLQGAQLVKNVVKHLRTQSARGRWNWSYRSEGVWAWGETGFKKTATAPTLVVDADAT